MTVGDVQLLVFPGSLCDEMMKSHRESLRNFALAIAALGGANPRDAKLDVLEHMKLLENAACVKENRLDTFDRNLRAQNDGADKLGTEVGPVSNDARTNLWIVSCNRADNLRGDEHAVDNAALRS